MPGKVQNQGGEKRRANINGKSRAHAPLISRQVVLHKAKNIDCCFLIFSATDKSPKFLSSKFEVPNLGLLSEALTFDSHLGRATIRVVALHGDCHGEEDRTVVSQCRSLPPSL